MQSVNTNLATVFSIEGTSGLSGWSGPSGTSGFSGLDGLGTSGYSGPSGTSGYSGPSGYSSQSGVSGYSGFSGGTGTNGTSGYSGSQGTSGYSGTSGTSGYSGYSGISGTSGTSGKSGYSGYSSPSGVSGYSGYSGISGTSGYSGAFSGISGFSGTSGRSGFSGSASGTPPGKNIIDNADMSVSQRIVTAGTLTCADDVYSACDRWYVLTQTGNTTTSCPVDATSQTQNVLKVLQANAAAQRYGVAQIVPFSKSALVRGKDCEFNFDIYQNSGGAADVRYAVLWWSGTADTVVSDVVNDWTSGTYTTSNFFKATTTSVVKCDTMSVADATWTNVNIPITSGEMGSATTDNRNLIVFVWMEDTMAQNTYFELTAVDFYEGSVDRNFQPKDPGLEYLECSRYAQCPQAVTGNRNSIGVGQATATSTFQWPQNFSTPMRIQPTLTLSAGFGFCVLVGGSAVKTFSTYTFLADNDIRCANARIQSTIGDTSLTVDHAYLVFSNNATGYGLFSADL